MIETQESSEQRNANRTVLAMVLINSVSTPIMLSAANVALPAMATELSLSAIAISWVPMAYLMASAMFILLFGKLADNYGRKKIFLLGTIAVIATSILAALSTNSVMLLSARFLQGVSAAMLYATQVAIVSSVYPPAQRGKAIGLVVAAVYVGLATGPVLGGLVTETLGWRFNFVLQLPLALIVLAIGHFKVPQEWSADSSSPIDRTGALLYSFGILVFCIGVSRLPAIDGILLIFGGIAILGMFVRQARQSSNPLWDVRLFFSNRVFTLSCAASLIMYSATYANVVLLSLYLQYIQELTPSRAGLIMMIQPVTMALLSPTVGKMSDRIEPRLLASIGMTITTVGLILLALLTADSSLAQVLLALTFTGVGFGLFSSPNSNAIMGAVDKKNYGSAAGALSTTRIIGQLFSIILVALSMSLIMGNSQITDDNLSQLMSAIKFSFGLATALCLPGILLSARRGRLHQTARE